MKPLRISCPVQTVVAQRLNHSPHLYSVDFVEPCCNSFKPVQIVHIGDASGISF